MKATETLPRKKQVKATLQEEKVCILGLGYVGLTLAVTLAEIKIKVVGVDTNKSLIDTVSQGKSYFYEKGLDVLVKKYLGDNFQVSERIPDKCDFNVFIIGVGTPLNAARTPDLASVEGSAKEIGRFLKPEDMVILRSTVPVGTTRNVVKPILERASGLKAGEDFSLVFAPERTVEGNALRELRELPQIIGAVDEKSFIKASNLFRKITPTVINVSSLEGAEMIKIMDNTHRDLNFAIANEMALICESLGLNAVELIKAANMGYNRTNIPVPSPGVGGACLSKDPYILLDVARQAGHHSHFIELGRKINEHMPGHVADKVKKFLVEHKKGKNPKIFILGFAFKAKPMTSDIRNSPTLLLLDQLRSTSDQIYGYDPAVDGDAIRSDFKVKPCAIADGFHQADAVIIMLNHDIFAEVDIFSLLSTTRKPCFFYDGWQLFKRSDILQVKGITYEGVGFV